MIKNWNTEATDLSVNENGIISGYISAGGYSFPFTAKLGEYASVEWADENDHKRLGREHREAQRFATIRFVKKHNPERPEWMPIPR